VSRKYERFKPNPRPENAVILTKKSVARSQLETAISLWFQHGDPISILVLAYNAHEILHALGAKIGKPSKLKAWLDAMPKRFQRRWEYVWNFCKHGLMHVDDNTPHDPRHADFLINFAGQCTAGKILAQKWPEDRSAAVARDPRGSSPIVSRPSTKHLTNRYRANRHQHQS
jgi:hypothetical protein